MQSANDKLTMPASLPPLALIGHRRAGDVVAWRAGKAIHARQYLADVRSLAQILPDARYMLNGCADRYHFAVAMAAALVRGQISVLPHNHVSTTLAHLQSGFQGLYCVTDTEEVYPELIRVRFPAELATLEIHPCDAQTAVEDLEDYRSTCIPADQMAACLFTSGSTGVPVAHQRTWGQIVVSAKVEAACLAGSIGDGAAAILGTVPAQHSYGFESTVHLALQAGWSFVAERPFFPADILDALGQLPRPRLLVTTPVHLRSMLGVDHARVVADLVLSATAPLPAELATDIESLLCGPVHEIYGSTETGQVASRRTLDGDEWQPLAGVVVGEAGGQAFAEGGHVGARTPLADHIGLRAGGRFVLLGRTADLVNIAGKRSSIAFLEKQLLGIEGVRDAAFLLADDRKNVAARVMAFVVAPQLTVEQIQAALRQRVEAVFLPRPLLKVAALPRDGTGKLPRQRLEALARDLLGRRDT